MLSWRNPRPSARDHASFDAGNAPHANEGCDRVCGQRGAWETSPLLSGSDPARGRLRRPGDGAQTRAQERSGRPRIRPYFRISDDLFHKLRCYALLTVTSIQRISPERWRGVCPRYRRKEWLSIFWMFTLSEE